MAGISEGEVAVYDRQLRLWGVQAQKRLLQAKVLIWGMEGCNVEACKNLVLAGVSLTIRDHRITDDAAVAFNYFLRLEDSGQNRAERAATRVQELNPLCTVSSSSAPPDEVGDAAALRKAMEVFDVVILSFGVLGFDTAKACAVDAACREGNSCFLMTVTSGELAFFFSDLQKHTMQERSVAQGAQTDATAQATAEPEEFDFPSLEAWMQCAPADLQKAKTDDSVLLVALFLAFSRSQQASPDAAGKFEDFCTNEAKCVPKVDGMPDLKHAYACFFLEPIMAVASVLAGLLSQEVIKAITKKDPPLSNSVCFNAHTSVALVERIPAAPKVLKRKAEEVVADLLD
mmetsp:Transcript_99215/g.285432  ORF Transcript_99215/g.285432 Transcript_99215/m.285432 type:complete len:344 (-) Transcript_99215:87-1118(-)|eukprot:CAMPEP_0177195556 /NCGR_PEP_ID=MMETSP0367-20130122/23584_1 /TAXON_ID=447022 ORGANISM="Scrippsiella hangoei-like, Strain SHHI-4" /NCGR_SAMPLE_ID=MMETSP0367 /ASSEMBLY_ACC=CAM_ASM_000362 /LENGTH=343 /DNA_ID=CAMNT_0018643607 /DNA_START=90 /DNA_END=1121 /DNA_ORIENTATION=+